MMRISLLFLSTLSTCLLADTGRSEQSRLLPEPPPLPFEQREAPYGVVLFSFPDDRDALRELLDSIRQMGAIKPQLLVYWWKLDTMGGDYWKEMGYQPQHVGEAAWQRLDMFIQISGELGLRPVLRLGTFRVFEGLYHPMDPTGSVENYAAFLRRLAARYRGRIDHYIIGDEENRGYSWGWSGKAEDYLEKVFIPLCRGLREGDPAARVSATSVSSAPATDWIMELIRLGLPRHGDGVAGNLSYRVIESLTEFDDMMRRVRRVWPEARFYSNGVGYADHRGLDDQHQAGIVAQSMFTLWDIGWDSAPYYTYTFSRTADTKQNFGLMAPAQGGQPAQLSAAWKAYQTIAQTFYNRDDMQAPDFKIELIQAERIRTAGGVELSIAPPDPVLRGYIRQGGQLLIYLAYRRFNEPSDGRWDVVLHTDRWGGPQLIPLDDYTRRIDLPHRRAAGRLVIENVHVGLQPAIITLRRISGT